MQRFLVAFAATVQGDTDLLAVTDNDDQGTYAGLVLPERASMTVLPRMNLAPKLNAVCVPAAQRYKAIGFLADDTLPETPGWDVLLLGALETPGIAYPQGHRRSDIPEHPFISSGIVTALGWFFEPSLCHFYADNVLADLGRTAGCLRHVPQASVRHMHYTRTCTPGDRTYFEAEVNGPADQAAYQAWRRERMAADAAVVRAAVTGDAPAVGEESP